MDIGKYWNRNLVVTGIPRSGTSLFCALMNDFENAVCINELWYDVDRLPGWFIATREAIMRGEPIPNRYDREGKLTTNTMVDGEDIRHAPINKPHDENILIGSKVNAPYLGRLDRIVFNRIPVVAIIRHPFYTLGSYQSEKVRTLNIANPLTDPRYRDFGFQTRDPIQCQAEIWETFASLIWNFRNQVTIIRYEDLTERTEETMGRFADAHGLKVPELRSLKNMNIRERYNRMDEVEAAVKKWVKSAFYFGYAI